LFVGKLLGFLRADSFGFGRSLSPLSGSKSALGLNSESFGSGTIFSSVFKIFPGFNEPFYRLFGSENGISSVLGGVGGFTCGMFSLHPGKLGGFDS